MLSLTQPAALLNRGCAPDEPKFIDGEIQGVVVRSLDCHQDSRGWLVEMFRADELPAELHPQMAYVSQTQAGVSRGPHEHREQTDCFIFPGPTPFQVSLWDAREESPTYQHRMVFEAGAGGPLLVIIPPGVVHGYRCLGSEAGLIFNLPNRLYAGPGKCESVDEIRHENDPNSPYVLEG